MLKKLFILTILTILITERAICVSTSFETNANYEVCFTPGEDCASKIIEKIARAKKEILVQAYSFTDWSIANALIAARKRGVDVGIILDKSQITARNNLISHFTRNGINPVIDSEPEIAHNKTIVIDRLTTIGGSYNYTKNAAKHNAENLTIITDHGFAKKYVTNWSLRNAKSNSLKVSYEQKQLKYIAKKGKKEIKNLLERIINMQNTQK